MNGACPPDHELQRLLDNQLSHDEEQSLEIHVADCEACQQRLDQLTFFEGRTQAIFRMRNSDSEGPQRPSVILERLSQVTSPISEVEVSAASEPDQSSVRKSSSDSTLRRLGHSTSFLSTGRFIRRQIWTWPLIAAALLGAISWWVSRSVETAMRQQRINELTTVLEADVAALRGWIENQRATSELVAADNSLRPLVLELLAAADDMQTARSQLLRASATEAVKSRLAEPVKKGGFSGFQIVSPGGVILANDEDAAIGETLSDYRSEFFAEVKDRAAVSKPFLSPLLLPDANGELRANQPAMYAAAPIRDASGKSIAALGLRIRPDDQFTRILQVARPGNSGETYAFDREGLLLSQSRFDETLKQVGLLVDQPNSQSILSIHLLDPGVNLFAGERPTLSREQRPLTRMAQAAIEGGNGYDVDGYRDYRGVPVVGAWRWLNEYDFGVGTEMDSAEAFAPVQVLRRNFALLMSLLTAAAALIWLAMLYAAHQHRKLQTATVAAQKFGQYTLVEELGRGGMGVVYKAQHALLRRPTAVKLLKPDTLSETSVARFEREVRLTSELSHPNTVVIYDYGRTPEGVVYYAMEFLEGLNLGELIKQYGPLPEERVVYLLRQVCGSLGEAHALGMVHRDVKPANIILTLRGGQHDFVKVLDFGLAKFASDLQDLNLTSTNVLAATPLYVCPEAITQSQQIDARADVYAIGAVGYFLLTGSPVFTGLSASDVCMLHLNATPRPPSARIGRPVSSDLEALLMRCLAKSPADRPNDALDVLCRLDECVMTHQWTSEDALRWWAQSAEISSDSTQVVRSKLRSRAGMKVAERPTITAP